METANDRFNHLASYFEKTKDVYITTKDTHLFWWKLLNTIWKGISFGKGGSILTEYTTTIGDTIYFPQGWKREEAAENDYITLCHELQHIEQYRTLGFRNTTLGFSLFLILYLFLPLPIVFAWFRYALERTAYLESYNAAKRLGLKPKIDYYVKLLTGPAYLWAWPFEFLVRRWFMEKCR